MTDPLDTPPSPPKKPSTLGRGEPECPECERPLGRDNHCPYCEPDVDETEIEL